MPEKFIKKENSEDARQIEKDFPVFTGKHERGSTSIFKKAATLAALSSLTFLSAQERGVKVDRDKDNGLSASFPTIKQNKKVSNGTYIPTEKDLNIKKSSESKKIEFWKAPSIDNFEYYDPIDTYNKGKNSTAYHNYMDGNFKYHEIKSSFKGANSSFWRARNLELGRDAYDSRLPLKNGEHVEKLKADQLMITDFSVKDGEKYDRAVIVEKGTEVIVDVNGHIISLSECCNPNHVSLVLCLPGQENM